MEGNQGITHTAYALQFTASSINAHSLGRGSGKILADAMQFREVLWLQLQCLFILILYTFGFPDIEYINNVSLYERRKLRRIVI
jgi:hypothetical protein